MLYKRKIFDEIEKYLFVHDIIVLHGARQVGKTHILRYIRQFLEGKKEKIFSIDLEDSRLVTILDAGVESFLGLLREEGVLKSEPSQAKKIFVFIDEIQYLEDPSSFLKLIADHHPEIKLIVSGSSSFAIKSKFSDSLAGRTVNFEIFPLSFEEFLIFKGYYFKKEVVQSEKKTGELQQLFLEYTLYGGYPKIVLTSSIEMKEKYLRQIIDTYIRKDIRDLAEIRDIEKFNKLLETLAAQSGNLLNVTELANTCRLSAPTIERYLFILENTYVIRLVRPYSRNLRAELFKVPKIYFYDTGIMQLLWLKGFAKEVVGNVFETSIFSELVKKYGTENILYWRTKDKREIDFILRQGNDILPLEAKTNFDRSNEATMKYFTTKYSLTKWHIVGLKGSPRQEHDTHPWML
jgi:predicted AAA+ superfamily ATPase